MGTMVCLHAHPDDETTSTGGTMAKAAASYIVRYGPATQQDRWEERAGHSPFTLAVEIAALLAAADMAAVAGERSVALYLREKADAWNDAVERWTYVSGTDLAHACGVTGYYVRMRPADTEPFFVIDRQTGIDIATVVEPATPGVKF